MTDDLELLRQFVDSKDRAALDELFGRHYPSVYAVVFHAVHNSFDARDLTQSTFLKALAAAEDFRPVGTFRNWLLKIAVNEVRQFWRKKRPSPRSDLLYDLVDDLREEQRRVSGRRAAFEQELDRALEGFDEDVKLPLVLHYFQELSLAEVGEILNLPRSTVQSRIERALQLLREHFRKAEMFALLPLLDEFLPAFSTAGSGVAVTAAALPASHPVLWLTGATLMKSKLTLFAAVLLLLLIGMVSNLLRFHREQPLLNDSDSTTVADDNEVASVHVDSNLNANDGDPQAAGALTGRSAETDSSRQESHPVGAAKTPDAGTVRISGRVCSAVDGAPITGASILFLSNYSDFQYGFAPTSKMRASAFSGEDGLFAFEVDATIDRNNVGVMAVHARFDFTSESAAMEIEFDEALAVPLELRLTPGRALTGRVVDRDTLHPVADATVVMTMGGEISDYTYVTEDSRQVMTVTDALGEFVFESAPASALVVVSADAPGLGAVERTVSLISAAGEDAPAPVDMGEIALTSAWVWRASVVDENGDGLAGAVVDVIKSRMYQGKVAATDRVATAITGKDGVFELEVPRTGRGYLVRAEFENLAPVIVPLDPALRTIVVGRKATVHVLVRDAEGGDVENCSINISGPGVYRYGDRDGDFSDLPAGVYSVSVSSKRLDATVVEEVVLDWGEECTVAVVLEPGLPFGGRVVTPSGKGVADAFVTVELRKNDGRGWQEQADCGNDGAFLFEGLVGELQSLNLYVSGNWVCTIANEGMWHLGSLNALVVAPEVAVLVGEVVGPAGMEPPAWAQLVLEAVGGDELGLPSVHLGETMLVRAEVAAGQYDKVTLWAEGCIPCVVRNVTLLPALAENTLQFELKRFFEVSGSVRDADTGAPITPSWVNFQPETSLGDHSLNGVCYAGRYEAPWMPAGEYTMIVNAPGYCMAETSVVCTGDDGLREAPDVTLTRAGVFDLVVVWRNVPRDGGAYDWNTIEVTLVSERGEVAYVNREDSGVYRLEATPPGMHTLEINGQALQQVSVGKNETTYLTLELDWSDFHE